jgi:uncharacterized protein YgiB involved in biofilm formation
MPSFTGLRRATLALLCLAVTTMAPAAATGHTALLALNKLVPESVLYSFQGNNDGNSPVGALLGDGQGGFFGTTQWGGGGAGCGGGCGTVFHMTVGAGGSVERIVHRFSGPGDGTSPQAGLIRDTAGALYGTTLEGGNGCFNPGCGVVFKLTPQPNGEYSETILYAFTGGADGGAPAASLVIDAHGDLVGTTTAGGTGSGVAFELTPMAAAAGVTYQESVLHAFGANRSDGVGPSGALIADSLGVLYGVTESGGTSNAGTVYALVAGKTGYVETILYNFTGKLDGASPAGALAFGPQRKLYGTVYLGGHNDSGGVFSLTPLSYGVYRETPIYDFKSIGAAPAAGVYVDRTGVVYGTTAYGGLPGCTNGGGCGIVFRLTPAGSGFAFDILHVFGGGRDASEPLARLIPGLHDELYGTTVRGGTANDGTVFRIR